MVSEDEVLEAIIVCFFADGSEKYTSMTTHAIKTFLEATPKLTVGLLTHDRPCKDLVMKNLPKEHHHRIIHQFTSTTEHIKKWNQTQFKLDLTKFDAVGFDYIMWVDSDTITYADLTPFFFDFAMSNAYFYFTPDHVMNDRSFYDNWHASVGKICPIPQACIMGFRSDIIKEFFASWKSIWSDWVLPEPFFKYKDPNPDFPGSAFCTEQYALGMALNSKELWISKVFWFRRTFVPIPKLYCQNSYSKKSSYNPANDPKSVIKIDQLRSAPPVKYTDVFVSKINDDDSGSFIDQFGDGIYHCYNHSYESVRKWVEQSLM